MAHAILEDDHMVSAGGVLPWHGLGTVLPSEALDASEALTYAHLDWEVEKIPVYAHLDTKDGYGNPVVSKVPNSWATVRMDTQRALAVVGDRFEVVQNRTAFDWMDTLLGDDGFHYHTAGSLWNGRVVWLLAKAPFEIAMADSRIDMYVLIRNSHDGNSAVIAAIVPIRVVCANTLAAALGSAQAMYKIRHTVNAEAKLGEAQRVLGLAQGAADMLEKRATAMLAKKLSRERFDGFLNQLVPMPEDKDGKSATMAQNTQQEIADVYYGEPTQADIVGTAWGAFQAVTFYVDHLQPTRVSLGSDAENRFRRSLEAKNLAHRAMAVLGEK